MQPDIGGQHVDAYNNSQLLHDIAKTPCTLEMPLLNRLESIVADLAANHERARDILKITWQAAWYGICPSVSFSPDPIFTLSNSFFGFHDKSPWDSTGVCIAAHRPAEPTQIFRDPITVGRFPIDRSSRAEFCPLATTWCWNWQQGSQLQWLPGSRRLVFNDCDDNRNPIVRCADSSNKNVETIAEGHLAAVDPEGRLGILADFSRIGRVMPGYGYCAMASARSSPDPRLVGMQNGVASILVSLSEIRALCGHECHEADDAVTHFTFSRCGRYVAFFYVRQPHNKRSIQLCVVDLPTREARVLPVHRPSHYCWGHDASLFITHRARDTRWRLSLVPLERPHEAIWSIPLPHGDAHPSYCHKNSKVVFDSYPDRRRIQRLFVATVHGSVDTVGAESVPLRFRSTMRCDFHPRWRDDGSAIALDRIVAGRRSISVLRFP